MYKENVQVNNQSCCFVCAKLTPTAILRDNLDEADDVLAFLLFVAVRCCSHSDREMNKESLLNKEVQVY